MRLLNRFYLVLFVIFLFSSCNLLISNPGGRVNINDPEAQVSNFSTYAIGTDSILTKWQWQDSYFGSAEEKIEEIVIVHSTLKYPEVRIPFLGESFKDSKISEYIWTGLDKNTTHYFALHTKDKQGRWYSPLFAKATLPGGTLETGSFSIITAWTISEVPGTIDEIIVDSPLDSGRVVVIEIQIPLGATVLSARINPLGIKTVNTNPLSIYSLEDKFELNPPAAWDELNNSGSSSYLVDEGSFNEIPGLDASWNNESIDITDAVLSALLSGSNQLVLKSQSAWNSIKFNKEGFLEIEYITN